MSPHFYYFIHPQENKCQSCLHKKGTRKSHTIGSELKKKGLTKFSAYTSVLQNIKKKNSLQCIVKNIQTFFSEKSIVTRYVRWSR